MTGANLSRWKCGRCAPVTDPGRSRRGSTRQWQRCHLPSNFCHAAGTLVTCFETVAVIALDQVAAFELGVLMRGVRHRPHRRRIPRLRVQRLLADGGPVRTASGFAHHPERRPGPARRGRPGRRAGPPGRDAERCRSWSWRRCAAPPTAGRYVLSVCSGAFVLGEAGLLDGRRCTTHWRYADELARRLPWPEVDPDVLYVDDGQRVLTSAGTAAGIDLCLHLVRQEHGSAVATALARRMVVPPHRDGGQAQYVEAPMPAHRRRAHPRTAARAGWSATLDQPHTVETTWPRGRTCRTRTFARRFRAETGATPHDWLTGQRVLLARRLLEDTELGVESDRRPVRVRRRRHAAPPLHPAGRHHPAGLPHHLPRPAPERLTHPDAGARPPAGLSSPAPRRRRGARCRPRQPPAGSRQMRLAVPEDRRLVGDGDLVAAGAQPRDQAGARPPVPARPARSGRCASTSAGRSRAACGSSPSSTVDMII